MSNEHIEHLDPDQWGDSDHSLVTDDAWHEHAGEDAPQHPHGQTTPGAIAIGGLVSFGAVILMVVFVTIYFGYVLRGKYEEVVEVDRGAEFRESRDSWAADLNEYGWADPKNDTIRVPLELAIDQVAAEYAR